MKTNSKYLMMTFVAVMAMVSLTGCLPEKRIVWSPNGEVAAVNSDQGLHFIDAEGKILPAKFSDQPVRSAWFPDSRQLAVVHQREVPKWSDVMSVLSKEQVAKIKEIAPSAKEQFLAYDGDLDKFELKPEPELSGGLQIALFMYVRDELTPGLREKLGEDRWTKTQEIHATIRTLQVMGFNKTQLTPGTVLCVSLDNISQPKVSPDGKNIGYETPQWSRNGDPATLVVQPVAGGKPVTIASNVAVGFDWSPDSRSVAYVRSSSLLKDDGNNLKLGALAIANVVEADGSLHGVPDKQDDRVGLIFNDELSVHWLKNNRILFSSVQMQLPATSEDMPNHWTLFLYDPKLAASVQRALARSADVIIDVSNPTFEVSPDETRVLLPGPKGRVVLYNFATGESTTLVDQDDVDGKLRTLPTWRNDAEICFVTPTLSENNEKKPGNVALWNDGKTKVLSANWPKEITKGWLTAE